MNRRNFVVTLKEPPYGKFALLFETDEDIEMGQKQFWLSLREGTTMEQAEALKRLLNDQVERVSLLGT